MNIIDIDKKIIPVLLQTGNFYQAIGLMLDETKITPYEVERIIKDIKKREEILTTYLNDGLIMPSGQIENKGFYIIIGTAKNPIIYNENSINIIVLFLFSNDTEEMYIDYLAYFRRLLMQKNIKEDILNTNNEDDMKDIIIKGLKEIED